MGKPLTDTLLRVLRLGPQERKSPPVPTRSPVIHVIILDGTMSRLTPGRETNAGLTYRLLTEVGAPVSVYYEAGIQLNDWRGIDDVMVGKGINRQIRRAYGYLASRYHPGDQIFLMGYSRGAYAVRSLAGMVDRVGLLRSSHATVRNVRQVFRIYQRTVKEGDRAFLAKACYDHVGIEMLGVWDTVKALGNPLPFFAARRQRLHGFHNHRLGDHIRYGYHALALDETRLAYAPVLWESDPRRSSHVEQCWFGGTHGDVGGKLGGFMAARPLANVSLNWMLERAESCGLPLPDGWRERFPADPAAPSSGTWRGWGKLLLLRSRRQVGLDLSERLHPSFANRAAEYHWARSADAWEDNGADAAVS